MVLWDTGVPQATLNDPKGWSTLPKLIVYHLDKSITGQPRLLVAGVSVLGLPLGDMAKPPLSCRGSCSIP